MSSNSKAINSYEINGSVSTTNSSNFEKMSSSILRETLQPAQKEGTGVSGSAGIT